MEKLYTVIWGTGSCDDHFNAYAYCGVHGLYRSEDSAKKALEECKQEILDEIYCDLDPDGENPDIADEVQIFGSVKKGYFRINYTLGTEPCEIHIRLVDSFVRG